MFESGELHTALGAEAPNGADGEAPNGQTTEAAPMQIENRLS